MHKLVRGPIPDGLGGFDHQKHTWKDLDHTHRTSIWQSLEHMQGLRCAYCEDRLSQKREPHIEHFYRRSSHPERTFDWTNLFGSCSCQHTCGKAKDNQRARADELIKPDVEDPEHYLHFQSNGEVGIRANLTPQEKLRAERTRDAFNLNYPPLRAKRREAARPYLADAEAFHELLQSSTPDDCLRFLDEEIAHTAGLPFATTIKHTLLR